MGKIPQLSGKKLIKILEKLNYQVIRQKGSHIRLEHANDKSKKKITVPNHKVIGRGLLYKIIRDIDMTIDKFLEQ